MLKIVVTAVIFALCKSQDYLDRRVLDNLVHLDKEDYQAVLGVQEVLDLLEIMAHQDFQAQWALQVRLFVTNLR